MRTTVFALVFLVTLVGAAPAQASLSFEFDWTSLASYSNLVEVNRVEPDGSITPFDQVRISKTQTGSGTLTLTPLSGASGYVFEFSGAGGNGSGQADADGTIRPGNLSFPVPSDVPIVGSRPFVGGRLDLTGDPVSPSAVTIAYYDVASPHCMFNCSALEFHGTGRTISASEPAPAFLLVLGVGAAIAIRSRRRRRLAATSG